MNITLLTMRCTELQHDQPQLYENLTKILGPDDQHVLHSVFMQADANAAAAAAAAQQLNGE